MKKTTINNILTGVIAILCVSIVFLIFCIAKRPHYTEASEIEASTIAEITDDLDIVTEASEISENSIEPSGATASSEDADDESALLQGKTSTRVNIRDNPTEDAKVLDTVEEGTTFEIVEILDNGWTHIIYDDNDAYISSSYVIIINN